MARKTSLTGDLAALAEEERARLGEPPDAELLIAFHDGELPEDEMERVRDWLAVDPGWASIYLDLKRGGLGAAGVASAGLDAPGAEDEDVDAAWRALALKLKREAPPPEVAPFPRRGPGRMLLALAATLVVAAGLAWFLAGRGEPGLPEGEYLPVAVTGETFRGSRISIPEQFVGVEFQIKAAGLSGELAVELLDASSDAVRRERQVLETGMEEIAFRVASSSLRSGKVYQLVVRDSGASPETAPYLDVAVTIVLEE